MRMSRSSMVAKENVAPIASRFAVGATGWRLREIARQPTIEHELGHSVSGLTRWIRRQDARASTYPNRDNESPLRGQPRPLSRDWQQRDARIRSRRYGAAAS